jgi:hypothetical protein
MIKPKIIKYRSDLECLFVSFTIFPSAIEKMDVVRKAEIEMMCEK